MIRLNSNPNEILLFIACTVINWGTITERYIPGIEYLVLGWFMFLAFESILSGKAINVLKGKAFVVLLFVAYVIVNGVCFKNPQRFYQGFLFYIVYPVVFFSVIQIWDKINIIKIARGLLFFNILNVMVGYVEYFKNELLFGTNIYYVNGHIRVSAFTYNYFCFGLLQAVFVIIGLFLFLKERKIYYMFLSGMCGVALLMSGSRGPMVACASGIIVLLFVINKDTINQKAKRIRFWLHKLMPYSLVVTVIIVGILLYRYKTSSTGDVFKRVISIFDWKGNAGNLGRRMIWGETLTTIANNPLWGIGMGATGSWNVGTVTIGVTESGVLKRFVELGIPFATLVYFFIIRVLLSKKRVISDKHAETLYLCYAIFAIVFVEDITLQITEMKIANYLYWGMLAYILCIKEYKSISINL